MEHIEPFLSLLNVFFFFFFRGNSRRQFSSKVLSLAIGSMWLFSAVSKHQNRLKYIFFFSNHKTRNWIILHNLAEKPS